MLRDYGTADGGAFFLRFFFEVRGFGKSQA